MGLTVIPARGQWLSQHTRRVIKEESRVVKVMYKRHGRVPAGSPRCGGLRYGVQSGGGALCQKGGVRLLR